MGVGEGKNCTFKYGSQERKCFLSIVSCLALFQVRSHFQPFSHCKCFLTMCLLLLRFFFIIILGFMQINKGLCCRTLDLSTLRFVDLEICRAFRNHGFVYFLKFVTLLTFSLLLCIFVSPLTPTVGLQIRNVRSLSNVPQVGEAVFIFYFVLSFFFFNCPVSKCTDIFVVSKLLLSNEKAETFSFWMVYFHI